MLAPSFDLAEQEMRIVLRIFLVQMILISYSDICSRGFIDIPVSDIPSASQSPVWQVLMHCLSIYCGMGGRMLCSVLTLLGSGHHKLHETYQCRIYGRKLPMMGKEVARNM